METTAQNDGIRIFSSSTLKILACIFMFIDHLGARVFPGYIIFRIIGRLAFPIFAFMIAEGCHYTRNKLKYFLQVFLLGVICDLVYFFYAGKLQGNILLTFSCSILIIFALQLCKQAWHDGGVARRILFTGLFVLTVASLWALTRFYRVDYGFMGVLVPVFPALVAYKEGKTPKFFKNLDRHAVKLACFSAGLLLLVLKQGITATQTWSLLAILPLALYNGRRGVKWMKYGFYLFYPLHLLLVEGIALLVL